jgi:hypothetical protein
MISVELFLCFTGNVGHGHGVFDLPFYEHKGGVLKLAVLSPPTNATLNMKFLSPLF